MDECGISRQAINDWKLSDPRLDQIENGNINMNTIDFNDKQWKPYTKEDVELMMWMKYNVGCHNRYMSMIFKMLLMKNYGDDADTYYKNPLGIPELIYFIEALQRYCGCKLVNENYESIQVHIPVTWNHMVASTINAIDILNVDKIDILTIAHEIYNDGSYMYDDHLGWATIEWEFDIDYVNYFVGPMIANGGILWPITEIFKESTVMNFNDNDESTNKIIENMIKEYFYHKKWDELLDIDGKGQIMRKQIPHDIRYHSYEMEIRKDELAKCLQPAIEFYKGILLAKKKYYQKKKKRYCIFNGYT